MNQPDVPICPICGDYPAKKSYAGNGDLVLIECERCGRFRISDILILDTNPPWRDVRHLVSAWIRRENKAKRKPIVGNGVSSNYLYSPEWADQFRHMGFPDNTNEKLDALLLAFADMVKNDYKKQVSYGLPHLIAEIAGKNIDEVNGLIDFLKEKGYVNEHPRITAKGWERIEELRKVTITSDSTFIAMWFNKITVNYRNAVIAAVEYCKYKPVIIDQQEYNDFIMNQVVSSIKQSRFMVADFTSRREIEQDGRVKNGVRGGVYWEAGMAYGLGRPVIHTCEDNADSRRRIHFDVDQYNTIFWKEDELGTDIRPLDQTRINPSFAEKLAARILATVGKGSYSQIEKNP